jgi:hypothetical protein
MARKRDDTVKLVLRLPPALHRRLGRAATRKNQSLNSEMIHRLEESFRWPQFGPTIDALRKAGYEAVVMMYRGPGPSPSDMDHEQLNKKMNEAADNLRQVLALLP